MIEYDLKQLTALLLHYLQGCGDEAAMGWTVEHLIEQLQKPLLELCATCRGEGHLLYVYERPGGPPGNARVPCPDCERGRKYKEKMDAIWRRK